MAVKHKLVNPVRLLFDTTSCPSCLRQYHTNYKVQRHLMYSEACRADLQARGRKCSPAPGKGSQTVNEQEYIHDGLAPVQASEGPHLCPGPNVRCTDFDLNLMDLLSETFYQARPDKLHEDEKNLRNAIQSLPLSWSSFIQTMGYFTVNYQDTDEEINDIPKETVIAIANRLQDATTWDFLQDDDSWSPRPDQRAGAESARAEECLRGCRERHHVFYVNPVPRTVGRSCILLHLYSGRRRFGDLQFFLDQAKLPSGCIVHTVSVDIMVDRELGDVTKASSRSYWLHSIEQRWTIGMVAGPPCETWSIARSQEIADKRRAPRVLRTLQHTWGHESVSLREGAQLQIGNDLLQFGIEALYALHRQQGIGLLEHPAEPAEPQAASVWRTEALRYLRAQNDVQVVRVFQGLVGAYSGKPTDLMAVRLPHLRQALSGWTLTERAPSAVSIGCTQGGEFLTTRLKEYPPALCRAFSDALAEAVGSLASSTEDQVPAWFSSRCKDLEVNLNTKIDARMGLDYAH